MSPPIRKAFKKIIFAAFLPNAVPRRRTAFDVNIGFTVILYEKKENMPQEVSIQNYIKNFFKDIDFTVKI